jgi:hypothetical protein
MATDMRMMRAMPLATALMTSLLMR